MIIFLFWILLKKWIPMQQTHPCYYRIPVYLNFYPWSNFALWSLPADHLHKLFSNVHLQSPYLLIIDVLFPFNKVDFRKNSRKTLILVSYYSLYEQRGKFYTWKEHSAYLEHFSIYFRHSLLFMTVYKNMHCLMPSY